MFQDSTLKVLGTVQLKRFGKMMRQWFNFVGEGPAAASTLLIKKEAITRIGGYNTSLRSTADLELMLRLQRGFEPIRNKKILVGYRQHKKQMHSNLNALSEEFLVLSKVHIQSKKQEKRHKKKANNYFYLANAAQKLDINALGYVRAVVLKPEVILLLLQLFKKLLLRKNRIMKKRTNKLLIEELLLLHNF